MSIAEARRRVASLRHWSCASSRRTSKASSSSDTVRAWHAAAADEVGQEHQVGVKLGLRDPGACLGPECARAERLGFHVVLDQPGGALGDPSLERVESGGNAVGRVDGFTDVVQQRRQEFLIRPQFNPEAFVPNNSRMHGYPGVDCSRMEPGQSSGAREDRALPFFRGLGGWRTSTGTAQG